MLTPGIGAGQPCRVNSDGVALLRSDVELFCGELVDHPPAIRLRLLAELRAMVEEVTSPALGLAMVSAQDEGWGLRRIAKFSDISHEKVRQMLAAERATKAE